MTKDTKELIHMDEPMDKETLAGLYLAIGLGVAIVVVAGICVALAFYVVSLINH